MRDVPFGGVARPRSPGRDEGYAYFDFLTAVDQTDDEADRGFDVVCHLIVPWSGAGTLPLGLPAHAGPRGVPVPSVTGVFAGAAWHERETHEMFGIDFDGFDDGSAGAAAAAAARRLRGHPLRKSFVLAARASKPWPGAKEPGEGHASARAPGRRRGAGARRPRPRRVGPRGRGAAEP